MPSPVRYAEVARMLMKTGWRFERSAASHFVWFKPGIGMFPVPVHRGMVKYVYVREIQKLNEAAQG